MTRLGWVILAVIALAAAAFGSMPTVGGEPVRDAAARVMPASAGPRSAGSPSPVPAPSGSVPADLAVVPVLGVLRAELRDNWGDPRDGGTRVHHGTDIPAAKGTPVIAVAPGVVERLFTGTRGGLTVYQRSRDGGWIYYYAHLSGYAPGLHVGQRLGPGDPIGYVGDTGDAGAGNFHLHFGLSRMAAGAHWWEGQDIEPYPWLAGHRASR